jgi:hypothetical protein
MNESARLAGAGNVTKAADSDKSKKKNPIRVAWGLDGP